MTITTIALGIADVFGRGPAAFLSSEPEDETTLKKHLTS